MQCDLFGKWLTLRIRDKADKRSPRNAVEPPRVESAEEPLAVFPSPAGSTTKNGPIAMNTDWIVIESDIARSVRETSRSIRGNMDTTAWNISEMVFRCIRAYASESFAIWMRAVLIESNIKY